MESSNLVLGREACEIGNQGSTRHMHVSGMASVSTPINLWLLSKSRPEFKTLHLPNSDTISSPELAMRSPTSIFLTLILPHCLTLAHSGGHHDPQQQVLENQETDWATRHMIEEHHISNLDPGAFFSLHDYDSSSTWTPGEILRTYGLDDPSSRDVPESKRQEVVRGVLDRFDQNGDGVVSRDEWVVGWGRGGRLPDFGVCLFDDVNPGEEARLNFTDVDLDLGSLDQGITVMTSTSMKFTILKSFTMRVRFPFLFPSHHPLKFLPTV